MSIAAQSGVSFEAIADGAAPGLLGEITVEIYDPSTGAVIVAPSTTRGHGPELPFARCRASAYRRRTF